jgi:hypothetical protein
MTLNIINIIIIIELILLFLYIIFKKYRHDKGPFIIQNEFKIKNIQITDKKSVENFVENSVENSVERTLTAYNDDYYDIIQNQTIKDLDTIFKQHILQNFPDNYQSLFQKVPSYTKIPIRTIFSSIVLQKLNTILHSQQDTNLIVNDIYNIYWKDFTDSEIKTKISRHFIFDVDVKNMNIKNNTLNWYQTLTIYLVVKDIPSILTDTGEYIEVHLDKSIGTFILQNTSIYNIKLNVSNDKLYIYNDKNYYKIKNKLHLMDPFLTSGKEIRITDEMKTNFQKVLADKKNVLEQTSKGVCYNASASTGPECMDKGGIWDTIPISSYECPFYKANQNYPNNFGELLNNACELPKNMQGIGNRYFSADPKYKPLCYNCKNNLIGEGSLGFCCDEQRDTEKYPLLLTPDYAFVGDSELRSRYSDIFTQKSLQTK